MLSKQIVPGNGLMEIFYCGSDGKVIKLNVSLREILLFAFKCINLAASNFLHKALKSAEDSMMYSERILDYVV